MVAFYAHQPGPYGSFRKMMSSLFSLRLVTLYTYYKYQHFHEKSTIKRAVYILLLSESTVSDNVPEYLAQHHLLIHVRYVRTHGGQRLQSMPRA
jgi:hypothetical protein